MIDTVRARLTAWYVAVLALTLVVFELAVYGVLSSTLHRRIDETLMSAIAVTATSLSNDLGEGQSRADAARATVDELSTRQVAVAVFDADGRVMAVPQFVEHDEMPALPDDGQVPADEMRVYDTEIDDDPVRVAVQRVTLQPFRPEFLVHVSTPLEPVEDELEDIRTALLSAIPLVLLVAGGGGWFLARKSLLPVVAMAERARAIGARSLDQRLPVANPRDELGTLASSFNELLGRLSAAFAQQRQFMADASHELRTPLATIRAATGVTLQREGRAEGEYRDAMRVIDDQTLRLSRIVEDMFTLARADSGHWPLHRAPFYLDELLQDVAASAVAPSGKTRRVSVTGDTDVRCVGDEDLVRRLFVNLVDNALKYSGPDAPVSIELTRVGSVARTAVTDAGPGIPLEAQPHIFERFFRGDKARTRTAGTHLSGAGLGLAIARWIAEAHQGSLELARSDGSGSTFAAELPCDPRS